MDASSSLPMTPAMNTLHSAAGLALVPRKGVLKKTTPLVDCNNCLYLSILWSAL